MFGYMLVHIPYMECLRMETALAEETQFRVNGTRGGVVGDGWEASDF